MEHYILLWQILSLLPSFHGFLVFLRLFGESKKPAFLYFSLALIAMMAKTVVFGLIRYGRVSGYFIFPRTFYYSVAGGLTYMATIILIHGFLIFALPGLRKRRPSLWAILPWVSASLISLSLYLYVMPGRSLAWLHSIIPGHWDNITLLSIMPFLVMSGGLAIQSLISLRQDKEQSILSSAAYLFTASGMVCMAFSYFIKEGFFPVLTMHFIFFYSGISLFLYLSKKAERNINDTSPKRGLDCFIRRHNLNGEEADLVRLVGEGKSNKEIAWELDMSLSMVKHRLFRLYRSCGVGSRWELIKSLGGAL